MAIHLKHSCRVFTIRRTWEAASSTVTSAISRRPSSKTIRRAACGVTSSVFATMLADTSGRAMTRSTSSGNVDDVRRPFSFAPSSFLPAPAGRAPSARSRRLQSAHGQRKQPKIAIAMPAPFNGHGFEAEIDGGEMRTGGDPGLAEDGGGQHAAEPRRMLEDTQNIPGIERNDCLQHRRQVVRLPQHPAPFFQPRVLVQSRS